MNDSSFDLIIRQGNVTNAEGTPTVSDVGVRDGRIAALAPHLPGRAAREIDATGHYLFPGFIDPHTHMGIPIKTTTSADDFYSGSIAAACGGTTTILDFTVQAAGQSLAGALDERRALAAGRSFVDYGIHVNVTDRPGQRLAEIPPLIAAGFNSFKAFTTYREAGMMMPWADFGPVLAQIHRHGGLLMLHAEDNDIVERETARHLAAGHRAAIYHTRSRPPEAEAKAISDAARIALDLGAALYIVHLSSQAGLEAALRARAQGAQLYLETCPHYLLLTEAAYQQPHGHYYIATPALRTQADCDALWAALAAGEIDAIGTDHCPFTIAQKEAWEGHFERAPNGIPAVETRFPLLYTYGVAAGRISLAQMVQLLAANPARIFGLDGHKGAIRPGLDADLVIWDPNTETTITTAQQHSRADWSPYEGWPIAGRLLYTLLRGQVLVADGAFVGDVPAGALLLANTPPV